MRREITTLSHLVWFDGSGNSGSVSRAEAVGEGALVRITVGCPVGICLHGCGRETQYQEVSLGSLV